MRRGYRPERGAERAAKRIDTATGQPVFGEMCHQVNVFVVVRFNDPFSELPSGHFFSWLSVNR